MKTIWTFFGAMMAASLLAQTDTNLPSIPAPVSSPAAETAPSPAPAMTKTNGLAVPPARHKKHKAVAKKKISMAEPNVALTPGPATVSVSNLVVRGQAGLKGEVIAHLYKGDSVTVLDQINLAKHAPDEPAQWAKISYPTNAHVWVSAKYIDTNNAVSTRKLNLRAGPGENFSVVGVLEKGAAVTPVETRGDWVKIEPPQNAYAFVAAMYLSQEIAPPVVTTPPVAPIAPTPTPVPEQPPIVTMPVPTPPPAAPQPPPVRIVSHEGVVGLVGSLIAPTTYKLYDPNTHSDIDFLFATSTNLDLSQLVDARVIVTGEEGIDERWPNIPVIAIQNIQVIGTNVVKRLDLTPPKLRHH